ncbi:hypothetical protein D9757_002229 [Collybiopsis confluens]|uniref:FAD-binding domain-containing protein n=1 Tax=Collybiopsis confluens TaxID=2823264 RepID=A0A8H5HZR9_9AGAR|nr:hypothetical protein D9757_002229 [Collybiopsis confluens]
MSNKHTTRIAIIGAGIGGLSAAISLRRLVGVDVQIFEQAKALREVGASIALGPNGIRGLEAIGATNTLSDEIAFRSTHGYPMVYKHWKTGEVLVRDEHSHTVTETRHRTARYFRPHLQEALANNIPPEAIHLRKRLVDVLIQSDSEDPVLLKFEDGSQYSADLVVGADGIHSTVRSKFFPDYRLAPTGQIALRAVFDSSLVSDLLAQDTDLKNSVHVVGPDRNFFSSMLGKGKFTVVGLGYDDLENSPWQGKQWDDKGDVESFRKGYQACAEYWNSSVTSLLERVPSDSLRVFPAWASDEVLHPVHTGRIVLLGDAFHPHGGILAIGGSLAIDDSVALYLSLQHVQARETASSTSSSRISNAGLLDALKIYSTTRLPHIREVCRLVVQIRGGAAKPGKCWNEEKIRTWAENKKEVVWLHEHDVHQRFLDALQLALIRE